MNYLSNITIRALQAINSNVFIVRSLHYLHEWKLKKGVPVSKVFNRQFQYYEYLQEIRDINKFETLSKQAIHDFLAHPTNIPLKNL